MSDIPDIDPTKPEDQGAAGGATGGGDENPQDYNLPGGPSDPADPAAKQKVSGKKYGKKGAKPKDPYAYQKLSQHDKDDIPMNKLPDKKNGLPSTSKDTEETSFIEGGPSGLVLTTAEKLATMEVEQDFPLMDHNKVEVRYRARESGGGRSHHRGQNANSSHKNKGGGTKKKLSTRALQKKSKGLSGLLKGFRIKILKSSKRLKKSKNLTKLSNRTEGLQMTKMNNLLYVTAFVKKLEKIPKKDHSLYRSKTSLNRRENRLWKGCPFGSG